MLSVFQLSVDVATGEVRIIPTKGLGTKDASGRFLHVFSSAGYHRGETLLPLIIKNIMDITKRFTKPIVLEKQTCLILLKQYCMK